MLFHLYYLASLASVSFPCISSVWFGGTAHLHISPSGHCLSIEICFLNIMQCRTNCLRYSVHTLSSQWTLHCHTQWMFHWGFVLTLEVLCFSLMAAFQFYAKKQGLNHSHPNFTAMLPIHHCPLYPLLPGSFP